MTVTLSRLKNGIRVITENMPHLKTASIGIWADVGARYEKKEQNGVSHLLEHMAFKGTKRRTARAIAEEIEAVGGHLNAYTSRDHTTYYARVMKEDVPLAADILADILQNSLFDQKELAREQDVILQEVGQVNDTPDDIIFDKLQETAFPDQPLGRSILGTEESIRNFTPGLIRSYMNTHYRGSSMVVAAAGNVSHGDIVSLIETAFADLPAERVRAFEPARFGGGECRIEKQLEQLHLSLGFASIPYTDPDYYALQVFSTVLGGGMSSRLFQEIRENRGLAYSVYSFTSSHADTGLFGIYAGTDPEQAGALMPVIAEEMKKLADRADEAEVARARAQLRAGLLMSLESSTSRIEQLGRQMLIFDRPLAIGEMIEKVDAIDVRAVQQVAARTLSGDLAVASVGQSAALAPFETIKGLFAI